MSDTHTRLVQGGITQSPDSASSPLVAATFTHRLLPERTIVRLVPEPLLEAERAALGVTGLELKEQTHVGHVRRRAVGFPEWPILNDPDNAQHALDLVADLKRLSKRARSKPGAVKTEINALADKLDASAPHFLPTFLEEAGRIFLEAGNTSYASQMFTKAREVERRHALLIDEERHRDVMMEFAFAGAVSVKEITAESTHLAERLEPAEAYERFRTLCLERIRGGLTPYSGMKKDLAKLAKAAGLKPADEEVALAAVLLRVPSILRANQKFWKDYKTAIRTAAKQDETLQAHLLTMSPEEIKVDDWIDILRGSGAIELVKQGEHPDFVRRIVGLATRILWDTDSNEELAPLLDEILPHAGCTTIAVPDGWLDKIPAEAWEQLLSHDVAIDFTNNFRLAYIDLKTWASREKRSPLPHLATSKQLRKYLFQGIERALEHSDEITIIATDPHLHPVVVELLAERVKSLESAPPTANRLTEVTDFVRHFELVDNAELQALLDRVRAYHRDLAEVFAETLRRGLPEELGWPEFEIAYGEKYEHDPNHWVGTKDCWPGVLVYNDKQLALVVGESTTEIQNWTGEPIKDATEADGQIAIVTRHRSATGTKISWSGAREPLDIKVSYFPHTAGLQASVLVPGGRLLGESVVVRPDQPAWSFNTRQIFVEGGRFWMLNDEEKIIEIDPDTGAPGSESMPDWFEQQCRRHPDLIFKPGSSQLRPVCEETEKSPFSTADGYHRHAVFHREGDSEFALIVDADGTEFMVTGELARSVFGVIRLPNGQPRILSTSRQGTWVIDPSDGMPTLSYGLGFSSAMWWHHTRHRDLEVSAKLRTITADDLRIVLERSTDFDVDDDPADGVGHLLDIDDYAVNHSIAQHAAALTRSWPEVRISPDAAVDRTLAIQEHKDILLSAMVHRWDDIDALSVWHGAARLGLTDRELPPKPDSWRGSENNWMELLSCADALLALAAMPGRTLEEAHALKELWGLLRDANLLSAEHLTIDHLVDNGRYLELHTKFPPLTLPGGKHYGNRYMVARADGRDPITIDGHTLELESRREITPSRTDLEPVFDALIERLREHGPQPWSPEPGKAFAAATGAPVVEAHLIMAGFPHFHTYEANFMPKEVRTAMGIKVAEAEEARSRLSRFDGHFLRVLAAGIPDDAEWVLNNGLNVQAMAEYWSEHGPAAPLQLPADLADRKPNNLSTETLLNVLNGKHDDYWDSMVESVLWLATEVDMSDPVRSNLADVAERLHDSPEKRQDLHVGVLASYWDTARRLNVPTRRFEDRNDPIYQSGRFTFTEGAWPGAGSISVNLSDITDADDPDLQQALELAIMCVTYTDDLWALKLFLQGSLSAYAKWLREPGDGDPHDPRAVVPELVEEAASTLHVSKNAAVYYLQLLAWPDPTDTNVRRWNEWKKADISNAGAELIDAGVVVEAKRSRAKRKYFLPGGWTEGQPPHLPIETWKTEPFGIFKLGARSKAEPLLNVSVAPLPPSEWFTACWERSQGEDAPQFEELETNRRSRR